MTVTQFNQSSNRGNNIFDAQDITAFFGSTCESFIQQTAIPRLLLHFRQFLFISTRIEFHTAYARQIVAVFTEEQAVKQLLDCLFGRRFARAHHAINRNTCCLLISSLISTQSIGNIATLIQFINVKRSKLFYTMDIKFCQQLFSDFIVGYGQYFTRFRINQIRCQSFANQTFRLHIQTG